RCTAGAKLRIFPGFQLLPSRYFSSSPIFFFQAEDGIRDGHVTGVQTCALPISAADTMLSTVTSSEDVTASMTCAEARPVKRQARSEERRVGKECRSRWSPAH